jgi:hypothetical protein
MSDTASCAVVKALTNVVISFYDLTGEMKLEDMTGKSLLAIEMLGLSIQALKCHIQKLLDNEGTNIKPKH